MFKIFKFKQSKTINKNSEVVVVEFPSVINMKNGFLDKLNALPSMTLEPTRFFETLGRCFKADGSVVKEWSIFDFSVTSIKGAESSWTALEKSHAFDVVPAKVLEIAKNGFDSLIEAYDNISNQLKQVTLNTRTELSKKDFVIQGLKNSLSAVISKNKHFNKVSNFINLFVVGLLATGLVGSYVTNREDYKSYKKTKMVFNSLLVGGVVASAAAALRMALVR